MYITVASSELKSPILISTQSKVTIIIAPNVSHAMPQVHSNRRVTLIEQSDITLKQSAVQIVPYRFIDSA